MKQSYKKLKKSIIRWGLQSAIHKLLFYVVGQMVKPSAEGDTETKNLISIRSADNT